MPHTICFRTGRKAWLAWGWLVEEEIKQEETDDRCLRGPNLIITVLQQLTSLSTFDQMQNNARHGNSVSSNGSNQSTPSNRGTGSHRVMSRGRGRGKARARRGRQHGNADTNNVGSTISNTGNNIARSSRNNNSNAPDYISRIYPSHLTPQELQIISHSDAMKHWRAFCCFDWMQGKHPLTENDFAWKWLDWFDPPRASTVDWWSLPRPSVLPFPSAPPPAREEPNNRDPDTFNLVKVHIAKVMMEADRDYGRLYTEGRHDELKWQLAIIHYGREVFAHFRTLDSYRRKAEYVDTVMKELSTIIANKDTWIAVAAIQAEAQARLSITPTTSATAASSTSTPAYLGRVPGSITATAAVQTTVTPAVNYPPSVSAGSSHITLTTPIASAAEALSSSQSIATITSAGQATIPPRTSKIAWNEISYAGLRVLRLPTMPAEANTESRTRDKESDAYYRDFMAQRILDLEKELDEGSDELDEGRDDPDDPLYHREQCTWLILELQFNSQLLRNLLRIPGHSARSEYFSKAQEMLDSQRSEAFTHSWIGNRMPILSAREIANATYPPKQGVPANNVPSDKTVNGLTVVSSPAFVPPKSSASSSAIVQSNAGVTASVPSLSTDAKTQGAPANFPSSTPSTVTAKMASVPSIKTTLGSTASAAYTHGTTVISAAQCAKQPAAMQSTMMSTAPESAMIAQVGVADQGDSSKRKHEESAPQPLLVENRNQGSEQLVRQPGERQRLKTLVIDATQLSSSHPSSLSPTAARHPLPQRPVSSRKVSAYPDNEPQSPAHTTTTPPPNGKGLVPSSTPTPPSAQTSAVTPPVKTSTAAPSATVSNSAAVIKSATSIPVGSPLSNSLAAGSTTRSSSSTPPLLSAPFPGNTVSTAVKRSPAASQPPSTPSAASSTSVDSPAAAPESSSSGKPSTKTARDLFQMHDHRLQVLERELAKINQHSVHTIPDDHGRPATGSQVERLITQMKLFQSVQQKQSNFAREMVDTHKELEAVLKGFVKSVGGVKEAGQAQHTSQQQNMDLFNQELADLRAQALKQRLEIEQMRTQSEARMRKDAEEDGDRYRVELQEQRIQTLEKDLESRRAEATLMMVKAREEVLAAKEQIAKAREERAEAKEQAARAEAEKLQLQNRIQQLERALIVTEPTASANTELRTHAASATASPFLSVTKPLWKDSIFAGSVSPFSLSFGSPAPPFAGSSPLMRVTESPGPLFGQSTVFGKLPPKTTSDDEAGKGNDRLHLRNTKTRISTIMTVSVSNTRGTPHIPLVLSSLFRLLARILTKTNASKVLGAYILFLLIKYRNTAYGIRPRPDLKGPRGLPLLGNTIEMLRRPRTQNYQFQTENHEVKYGSYYTISLPGIGRVINISDPEMLDHVLRVNFWAYEKGSYLRNTLAPMVGQGIFGADGEHWRWQRKLASHIFNVKSFRSYTSGVFCREAQLVVDYFSKVANTEKIVDLQSIFYLFTLDSFGEIAFGQSFGCLKDPEQEVEFAAAFDRLNHVLSERIISPVWKLKDWWTGRGEIVRQDTKTIHDFAHNVIVKRRQEDVNGRHHKDLMQLFMDARDEHGQPLSDEMLKDELINMILAGRDTTAQALSWTFYLLHRSEANPGILSQLTEEIDSVLKDGLPTYESTKQQKYAEACFYETLRLYPSVPQNMKVCVADDVLPNGPHVYKGENVGWCTWAMGRLESIWGPDAKEFKPERWMTGDKPSSAKFASFHLGPRACLGQQFATIEAITIVSMLLQKFTFELVDPKTEPAYIPALTLPMTHGLRVRIRRRSNNLTV
ncbi:hypothetical protein BGX28_003846 [Mortierella sp. GBA30]|nr:hypothetical protein BGX28_003846 [Mortierella sp. GBA30]